MMTKAFGLFQAAIDLELKKVHMRNTTEPPTPTPTLPTLPTLPTIPKCLRCLGSTQTRCVPYSLLLLVMQEASVRAIKRARSKLMRSLKMEAARLQHLSRCSHTIGCNLPRAQLTCGLELLTTEGLFLVSWRNGQSLQCVGVDCGKGLIFDCTRATALPLTKASLLELGLVGTAAEVRSVLTRSESKMTCFRASKNWFVPYALLNLCSASRKQAKKLRKLFGNHGLGNLGHLAAVSEAIGFRLPVCATPTFEWLLQQSAGYFLVFREPYCLGVDCNKKRLWDCRATSAFPLSEDALKSSLGGSDSLAIRQVLLSV